MENFLLLSTAVPVVYETISLCDLGGSIGDMARKKEVISGLDFPS